MKVTLHGTITRLVRQPVPLLAAVYLVAVVGAVAFAPWLAPFGPDAQDLANPFSGPSRIHPLGSGALGKDVLSRLLFGGRRTLTSVAVAVSTFAAIGVTVGIVAGYVGGRVDRVVLRISDVLYATPAAIILLVVIAIYPDQQLITMIALGVLGAPSMARVVRSVTRTVAGELFVAAARVSGLGPATIMRRHLLGPLAGPIIVQLTLFGAAAIGLETALGFLGLGPSGASWGALVAEASRYIGVQPWLLVPSGLNIIFFIVALGLVGDGVRDALTDALTGAPMSARRAHRGRRRPPDSSAATGPAALDAPVATTLGPPLDVHADALLAVNGLTSGFVSADGVTTIVRDVSLQVARGRVVGIVGESGCGKSVTVASALHLLPDGGHVLAGDVRFAGNPIRSDADAAALRGRHVGWISQHPIAGLDPAFTVGSQLAEVVRRHTDVSRRDAERRGHELLVHVQLTDPERVAASYPHQLSGGMAQRVAIALAIAGEPDLLVADEPTTALDVTVQAEVLDLLRDLVADGMAVLLITHNWGVVADICDDCVVMYAGEVVEHGPVEQVIAAPRHPYTAALLRANTFGVQPGVTLPSIPGQVLAAGVEVNGCRFADRCDHAVDACRATPVALDADADGRLVRCRRRDEITLECRAGGEVP